MIYGLIIAAGNQTRFKSDIPKALSKIGDRTCLDINISHMKNVCDEVYVVCSFEKEEYFKDYNHLSIESGLGCGDAVLKALRIIKPKEDDMVFIQWGDSIVDKVAFRDLNMIRYISLYKDVDIFIASRWEKKPYVLLEDHDDFIKVKFSKYGEVNSDGYHDLSLFFGNAESILYSCEQFKDKYFVDNGYIHKHGNEFNFLDLFNDTSIKGCLVDAGTSNSYSFNTEEEYKSMLKEIGDLYV